MKATPEIPLSMDETEITQAGSIAFSIGSPGVESSRRALKQLIKREQDAWNELAQEGRCIHDIEGDTTNE